MKKLLTLLVAFFIISSVYAQYDRAKINKKAIQLYDLALQRIDDGNLTIAAGQLMQAIELDKNYVEAYLTLAAIYGKLKSYKSSILNYEKAISLDSNYTLDYKLAYSIQLGAKDFPDDVKSLNSII